MKIEYVSHNFPSNYSSDFVGTNELDFTAEELIWSAITVGRANIIDVLRHGVYSKYEILYRVSIIFSNLALQGGDLYKSSAYQHLDPSEKSAVSYFLGLTFTKLLSNKLLNIPWLLHIDVYREQFENNGQALGFGSSRIRPDLIGLNSQNKWVVMEAKGRTNTMEASLLGRAKLQTQNLRYIGADTPELRVAVVAHFINDKLLVDWADPEKHSENSFDINTNKEEFIQNYYQSIYDVLSSNKSFEIDEFTVFEFTDINIIIGLETKIFKQYKNQRFKAIDSIASLELRREENPEKTDKTIENKLSSFNKEYGYFIGSDGVLVGLGENWVNILETNKVVKNKKT